MILWDNKRNQATLRRSKTLDKSQWLSPESYNLLMAEMLLKYEEPKHKKNISKALKTGTLHWDSPNGPVTIKKKKKIINFRNFKRTN